MMLFRLNIHALDEVLPSQVLAQLRLRCGEHRRSLRLSGSFRGQKQEQQSHKEGTRVVRRPSCRTYPCNWIHIRPMETAVAGRKTAPPPHTSFFFSSLSRVGGF